MVDIHCHILPEVDDGAWDMEAAVAMARIARDCGVKKIITTPHFKGEPGELEIRPRQVSTTTPSQWLRVKERIHFQSRRVRRRVSPWKRLRSIWRMLAIGVVSVGMGTPCEKTVRSENYRWRTDSDVV